MGLDETARGLDDRKFHCLIWAVAWTDEQVALYGLMSDLCAIGRLGIAPEPHTSHFNLAASSISSSVRVALHWTDVRDDGAPSPALSSSFDILPSPRLLLAAPLLPLAQTFLLAQVLFGHRLLVVSHSCGIFLLLGQPVVQIDKYSLRQNQTMASNDHQS